MNDISDDEEEESGLLGNATARDSLALQAYLRERKMSASRSDHSTGAGGLRSSSPLRSKATMNIDELENTLTVLSPGLRVKTSFSSTRGTPAPRTSSESPVQTHPSPSKRFDEGGGVYIEDSTRSLRSMVKKAYDEKRQYQQTIHEKQLEIEALKKSFLEMTTRCERLNMLMNRSKKVMLPSRLSFTLERWAARSLGLAFHCWKNAASEYSTGAMKRKEDMMNRERQDWLTVRNQWSRHRGELSGVILSRTVRAVVQARLAKSFRRWSIAAHLDKSCELVKQRWIDPFTEKSRIKIMYTRWKFLYLSKRTAYRLLIKIGARLCFRALLAAWNRWKMQLGRMHLQKHKFKRALVIINLSSPYARCLEKWRHYAFILEPRRLRLYNLICSCSTKKSRCEQRQYFNSWKAKSKTLGLIPSRVSRALWRSEKIITKNFFHRWCKSVKKKSKARLAFASLSRCAKDSIHSRKLEAFSRWYRASVKAQISELKRDLIHHKSELSKCHNEIQELHGAIEHNHHTNATNNLGTLTAMRRSALQYIILTSRKQSTVKYFTLWRLSSFAESGRIGARRIFLIQSVSSKMLITCNKIISSSFSKWVSHTTKICIGAKILTRLIATFRHVACKSYFDHWARTAAFSKSVQDRKAMSLKRINRVVSRILTKRLARGMLSWKQWLNFFKNKMSGALRVQRLMSHGSTRQCFMWWRRVSSDSARREHERYTDMVKYKQKKHAISMLRRVLLIPIAVHMSEWKEVVKTSKLTRVALRRITLKRQSRQLRDEFLSWRARVNQLKTFIKSTELIARGFSKYAHNMTQGALLIWKSFARRHNDHENHTIQIYSLKSMLAESSAYKDRLVEIGQSSLVMANVFRSWHQYKVRSVSDNASKGKVMQSTLCRLQRRAVAAVFNAWLYKTSESHRFEYIMKRSLTRLVTQQLDLSFKTWSRYVFIRNRDNHINYLKHCSDLHISTLEADYIIQKMFHKWSRFILSRRRHRSLMKRTVLKMKNVHLIDGFVTWKSFIVKERKIGKAIRLLSCRNLRLALYTWKMRCSTNARNNILSRTIKRMMNVSLLSYWRKWCTKMRQYHKVNRLLGNVVRHWLGASQLKLSTAFGRLRMMTLLMTKRDGYSDRTRSLYQLRGCVKAMRKAFDAWKMYSTTVLKSRGIEILGCLESIFPILNKLTDVVCSEADASKADVAFLMDGDYEDTYSCADELRQISTETCATIQGLLPEYICTVYAYDPDAHGLLRCEASPVVTSPHMAQMTPTGISSTRGIAGSIHSPPFRQSAVFAESPLARTHQYSTSPAKSWLSANERTSTASGNIFHSLHDFDDGMLELPPQHHVIPSTENDYLHYVEVGVGGGDVGMCAQTGAHIVRRSLISEALLYRNSQRNFQSSPDKISSPLLSSRTVDLDRMTSGGNIFGRSLSKSVSFSPFGGGGDDSYSEDDDYIYTAVVPISWKGEVVGVVQLRSVYLLGPQFATLSNIGFDVMNRPECVLNNTEKQSWFLFSKSPESATMQVYPVCMKIGLDVERTCGMDTAIQLGGWAMRAAISKDKRKKSVKHQFLAHPPGPTKRDVITRLETGKERMHGEIQDLTSKLLLTGKLADKLTEKSAKYKMFAESWKKRSENLQFELMEANERIRFLVNKYGDVKRIHDSLQHITEETFAMNEETDDDYSLYGRPTSSPMR